MADTTKIGPIFRGANGGLSDDLFTGIKNSFYYSNDMEIREDAKSIFPMGVPAYADPNTRVAVGNGGSGTLRYQPICVFYSYHDGGWIVCGQRNIYLVEGTNTVTSLCSFSENICDAEIFNGYIYVATRTHVYYKKDNGYNWSDMASSTDATAVNYGRCDTALQANANHPLYASDVCICVGDENTMWKITAEIPNLLQPGFTIQSGWYIRFINELGGFIRAVAVDEPYGSEVLFWDKYSTTVNEVIPLEGYSIIGAIIYNGYHYLLSDKGFGLLNGYQYYLLKKVDGDVNTTTRNCMCVYDDKLFFVANEGIYIYGAKNKNYNDVLALWHAVEPGYKLGAIGSYTDGIMVTRSGAAGSPNIPIYVGVNQGQATTGEMQTMCYFGTSMSEIKQSMYLRVGYHIPKQGDNSGNIHIYYRTEADATTDNPEDREWHEATKPEGLYADWDMRSPFATTLKLNCRFQWIQFKFVLTNCVYTSGADTLTKDTNLYSADLYYNVMLD